MGKPGVCLRGNQIGSSIFTTFPSSPASKKKSLGINGMEIFDAEQPLKGNKSIKCNRVEAFSSCLVSFGFGEADF